MQNSYTQNKTFCTEFLRGEGRSFSSKVKIRIFPSRLSEYIPYQNSCYENFQKIKVCGGVFILKIVMIYSSAGSLKALVLVFQEFFSNQAKVVNENIESIIRVLCKL